MSQIKEIFGSLKTQAVNINFFKEYVLNQRFGEAVMARCANGKKLYFYSNICAGLEKYCNGAIPT